MVFSKLRKGINPPKKAPTEKNVRYAWYSAIFAGVAVGSSVGALTMNSINYQSEKQQFADVIDIRFNTNNNNVTLAGSPTVFQVAEGVRPEQAAYEGVYNVLGRDYVSEGTFTVSDLVENGNEAIRERIIVGQASYYGTTDGFSGKPTANGETYDPDGMTMAHPTLPMGTIVEVVNADDPTKSVYLRVNDRGPFMDGRIADLSPRAAEMLGYKEQGIGNIIIRVDPKLTIGATMAGRMVGAAYTPAIGTYTPSFNVSNLESNGVEVEYNGEQSRTVQEQQWASAPVNQRQAETVINPTPTPTPTAQRREEPVVVASTAIEQDGEFCVQFAASSNRTAIADLAEEKADTYGGSDHVETVGQVHKAQACFDTENRADQVAHQNGGGAFVIR